MDLTYRRFLNAEAPSDNSSSLDDLLQFIKSTQNNRSIPILATSPPLKKPPPIIYSILSFFCQMDLTYRRFLNAEAPSDNSSSLDDLLQFIKSIQNNRSIPILTLFLDLTSHLSSHPPFLGQIISCLHSLISSHPIFPPTPSIFLPFVSHLSQISSSPELF
jgi:hypothetical protein